MFDVLSSYADETVTLSAVLERLSPHLAQIKVLHKVFCTGVAEVPPETPNVVRASHLLNTLYKAIIEYDSVGEASEQAVSVLSSVNSTHVTEFVDLKKETVCLRDHSRVSSSPARWPCYFLYGQRQSDHIWRLWMNGLFTATCLTLPRSSSSRGM